MRIMDETWNSSDVRVRASLCLEFRQGLSIGSSKACHNSTRDGIPLPSFRPAYWSCQAMSAAGWKCHNVTSFTSLR